MNKKEKILKMYYEEHQKQKDIATRIKVTQSYVSQVIKDDERYNTNKVVKHKLSMIKKANYNKEYYKTYTCLKKEDTSCWEMQALVEKDVA